MPSLTTRTAQLCAAAFMSLAAACSKGEKAAPADSAAGAAAPRPLVGSAAPAAGSALPGALIKSIDDYSGDELYTFVKGLSFVGSHTRDRRCKDAAGCASTKKVKVTVAAVNGQDSLGMARLGQYGVIAVQALNKGDAIEAMYGLQPDSKKLEYYLIVTAKDSTTMRWRLEELDSKASPRTHRQVAVGTFKGCGHVWAPSARADFKTCEQAASSHTTKDGRVVRLSLLQSGGDPPLWVTCDQGCCTASEP